MTTIIMAPSWPVHAFMGKWLTFPAKQVNFAERQKTTQFFSEAIGVFGKLTLLEVPGSSGWL